MIRMEGGKEDEMEKRVYITRNTTALHFQGFLLLRLYISDVAPFFVSDTRYTLLYDLYLRWMDLSFSLLLEREMYVHIRCRCSVGWDGRLG